MANQINELTTTTALAAADAFPIWSALDKDTRKATIAMMTEYVSASLATDLDAIYFSYLTTVAGYKARPSAPIHPNYKFLRDGIWYSPDWIVLVWAGQSNAIGVANSTDGPKTINPNVFAWDNAGAPRLATLGFAPFNTAVGAPNNISFHHAARLEDLYSRPVMIITKPVSGSPIGSWFVGQANWDQFEAQINAALAHPALWGQTTVDVFGFHLGESAHDALQYTLGQTIFPSFILQCQTRSWSSPTMIFIAGEMLRQEDGGVAYNAIEEWRRAIAGGNIERSYLASSEGLTINSDGTGVHFNGASLATFGKRYGEFGLTGNRGLVENRTDIRDTTDSMVWKGQFYTLLADAQFGPSNVNNQNAVVNVIRSDIPVVFEVDGVRTEVLTVTNAATLVLNQASDARLKVWYPAAMLGDMVPAAERPGVTFSNPSGNGTMRRLWVNPNANLRLLFVEGHNLLQYDLNTALLPQSLTGLRFKSVAKLTFDGFKASAMPPALMLLDFSGTTPIPGPIRAAITDENTARGGAVSVTFSGLYLPYNSTEYTPKMFGAVGDGIADDTAAIVRWAAAFDAARAIGPAIAAAGAGSYLMTGPVSFKEPATGGNYRSFLDMAGARFICNYNRTTFANKFITFGDAANPTVYNSGLDIGGGAWYVETGPACTMPPVGIYLVGFAQSQFDDVQFGTWAGTCLEVHGAQNAFLDRLISYGGGRSFGYSNTTGSNFRQTGSNLNVVSGAYTFPLDCVGKTIYLANTSGTVQRKCRILTRVSGTQVTVGQSTRTLGTWLHTPTTFTDATDVRLLFGGPAVTTTSGSAVVTLDGAVTADMVGLFVGITGAGNADGKILWADIVSVNTGASQITLSKNAAVTLNPVANPLTETNEIATPVVAIRSDVGGAYSNGISQVFATEWQIETYRGLGIGVDDAEIFDLNKAKIHGSSSANRNWNTYSLAPVWANRLSAFWQISFDQNHLGSYRMRVYDTSSPLILTGLRMRTVEGEKLMYIGKPLSGFNGPAVVFGDVAFISADNTWTFSQFVDAESTLQSYVSPRSMNRNNLSDGEFWLGSGVKANTAGDISARSITTSLAPITFTPVVADAATAGNVGTASAANGAYERIGNQIFVSIRITGINTTGMTAGNPLYIRGLPIPVRGGVFFVSTAPARMNNITFAAPPVAFADDGDSWILFYIPVSAGTAATLNVSAVASGTADIFVNFSYFAL